MVSLIQARALIVNGPVPSKHSPHPPVPRTPNNTVPTLQKCPLIQEKSLSPLETARITQFCAVCASKCPTQKWVVWRSGSTSRSDRNSLQNPHGESAICKISACGEQEEMEWGFSFCNLTAIGRRVPRRKNRCGQGGKSVPPLTISARACSSVVHACVPIMHTWLNV